LINSTFYSGVEAPIRGIAQAADQLAGTNFDASVKAYGETFGVKVPIEQHPGTGGWLGQQIGGAVGSLVPLIITHRAIERSLPASLSEQSAGHELLRQSSTKTTLGLASQEARSLGATGFAYGVLQPGDEQAIGTNKFYEDRLTNGVRNLLAFGALGYTTPLAEAKLGALAATLERSSLESVVKSPLAAAFRTTLPGMIGGIPSGIATAEFDAWKNNCAADMTGNIIAAGIIGGAFGTLKAPAQLRKDFGVVPRESFDASSTRTEFTQPQIAPSEIVSPIDRAASPETKVSQLRALSLQNEPAVRHFMQCVDDHFGSVSSLSFKRPEVIKAKSVRPEILKERPWYEIEHIRDTFRFRTVVDDLRTAPEMVKQLKSSQFEVVQCDTEKIINPKQLGWRALNIDLRAPNGQLIEWQIVTPEMNNASKAGLHDFYKTARELDPALLSYKDRLELRRHIHDSRRQTDSAWAAYLTRMNLSSTELNDILADVQRHIGSRS
jgi:hypothetical protein